MRLTTNATNAVLQTKPPHAHTARLCLVVSEPNHGPAGQGDALLKFGAQGRVQRRKWLAQQKNAR